jgi:hypothetical protein
MAFPKLRECAVGSYPVNSGWSILGGLILEIFGLGRLGMANSRRIVHGETRLFTSLCRAPPSLAFSTLS